MKEPCDHRSPAGNSEDLVAIWSVNRAAFDSEAELKL